MNLCSPGLSVELMCIIQLLSTGQTAPRVSFICSGLKNKVKVMIGGAPVTRAYADEIGAEGFAEDCASGIVLFWLVN